MDKLTIGSITIRKVIERVIQKWLKKKGFNMGLIFTSPVEVRYNDETKMIDADIQIHVTAPLSDFEKFLGE